MKSIHVIGGLLLTVVMLTPVVVDAAILSIFPERPSVYQDSSVRLELGVDTESERINTVQALLLIPESLEVVAVETGGSLIDLWIEKPAQDPETGIVRFVGGLGGGFAGRGLIGTIVVRPREIGEVEVSFDGSSAVLLHDGAGTSANLMLEGTKFEVLEAAPLVVTSPTHPEDTWSAAQSAIVEWEPKDGAVYSWSFDANPDSVPDTVLEEPLPPLEIPDLGDGMHYFHLREGMSGAVAGEYEWSQPVHLRLLVDTTAPRSYEPMVISEDQVMVSTRDESAGVELVKYQWKSAWIFGRLFGGSKWRDSASAELVQVPKMLKWFGGTLTLRAVDGAGNAREQSMEFPGSSVTRTVGTVGLIVVVLIVLAGARAFRRKKAGV